MGDWKGPGRGAQPGAWVDSWHSHSPLYLIKHFSRAPQVPCSLLPTAAGLCGTLLLLLVLTRVPHWGGPHWLLMASVLLEVS